MSEKLGQEPAYPEFEYNELGGTAFVERMSKRFYAACAAMQGYLSNPDASNISFENICKMSYTAADELLKQENQ